MAEQECTQDAQEQPIQEHHHGDEDGIKQNPKGDLSGGKGKWETAELAQKANHDSKRGQRKPPKLAPRHSGIKEEKNGTKDGADLTTILDEAQRADLTILLANASEWMRKVIEENFEASAGLNKALLRENMTEDEKLMSADIDPGSADVAAFDRERKLREQYQSEVSTPEMTELKRNALKAFDEWRETVMERVGQVVNSERTVRGQLDNDAKAGMARRQAPDHITLESILKKEPNQGIKLKFKDLYPPMKTPLTKLSMQQRTLVLHSVFLLLLSLEHYNAPSRVLLLHLTSSLKLPLKTFEQDETTVAKGLLEVVKELTADEETRKKIEANKESRKWRVGLATAAGAAVIGISGGMAAPLVSAGVGTIMGSLGLGATAAAGYLGAVAGSAVLVGGLFGAYGGRMTGQMMDNYAREVEDFEFLPVHSRNRTSENAEEGAQQATKHNHKLRITICVSGWLTEKDEVVSPWKVIGRGAEVFALKWELEALLNLGNAMNGLVQSAAWGYAQKQLIQQTVFADLMAAMWPIGLVKAAGVIDNPFSVAKARAEKAGEVLADALINRAQGERPVTLIGYSLGARVIYTCLMSLAHRNAFGLIESAILIGAPTPSDTNHWRTMRTVVSARLVNIYSENDYVLGFMYRTSSIQYGVAGLQKVEGLSGVENVNVTEDVKGHLRYRYVIGSILKKIGFDDVDMQAVQEEHVALEKMEEEEKRNSLRAQKNRLLRRQTTGGTEDEAREAEEEANEIQKEVAAKTQKSLVTRVVEYFYLPKSPSNKQVEENLANIQKAAEDPSEAGRVAIEAVRDIQASGQSYAQWAAQKLPRLPGIGTMPAKANKSCNTAVGTAESASKATDNADAMSRGYSEAAAKYLPSFRGNSKKSSNDTTKGLKEVAGESETRAEHTLGVTTAKATKKSNLDDRLKTVDNTAAPSQDTADAAEKKAGDAIDHNNSAKVNKETTRREIPQAAEMAEDTQGTKEASSKSDSKAQEQAMNATESTQNAASDATSTMGLAVEDATASAKNATGDAASSERSYTQRAAEYLPNLVGSGKRAAAKTQKTTSGEPNEAEEAASDPARDATASAQSYTSKVAGYLPKFGGVKTSAPGSRKPADGRATEASKAVTENVRGAEPSELDGKKAATDAPSSAQGYTSRAVGYLHGLSSVSGPGMPSISSLSRGRSDSKPEPAAADRPPSEPKRKPPKLGRKSSETPTPASILDRKSSEANNKSCPKLEGQASDVKRSIPKLDRKPSAVDSPPAAKLERTGSGAREAIPKLSPKQKSSGVERTVSGKRQQSIPKLGKVPSGMKSPPAELGRTSSTVQSPPAELARTISGDTAEAAKLDRISSRG